MNFFIKGFILLGLIHTYSHSLDDNNVGWQWKKSLSIGLQVPSSRGETERVTIDLNSSHQETQRRVVQIIRDLKSNDLVHLTRNVLRRNPSLRESFLDLKGSIGSINSRLRLQKDKDREVLIRWWFETDDSLHPNLKCHAEILGIFRENIDRVIQSTMSLASLTTIYGKKSQTFPLTNNSKYLVFVGGLGCELLSILENTEPFNDYKFELFNMESAWQLFEEVKTFCSVTLTGAATPMREISKKIKVIADAHSVILKDCRSTIIEQIECIKKITGDARKMEESLGKGLEESIILMQESALRRQFLELASYATESLTRMETIAALDRSLKDISQSFLTSEQRLRISLPFYIEKISETLGNYDVLILNLVSSAEMNHYSGHCFFLELQRLVNPSVPLNSPLGFVHKIPKEKTFIMTASFMDRFNPSSTESDLYRGGFGQSINEPIKGTEIHKLILKISPEALKRLTIERKDEK